MFNVLLAKLIDLMDMTKERSIRHTITTVFGAIEFEIDTASILFISSPKLLPQTTTPSNSNLVKLIISECQILAMPSQFDQSHPYMDKQKNEKGKLERKCLQSKCLKVT